MRRHRRTPPPGDFEDPISNYDAPELADDFEHALCEDRADALAESPCPSLPEDTTVQQTIAFMNEQNTGAVIVVNAQNKPVGIVSERDVLNRIAGLYAQLKNRPVAEIMTPDPAIVYRTDTPARVMNMMDTGGFRHVPVVDADEKLVGMIGARRLTEYLQKHFT